MKKMNRRNLLKFTATSVLLSGLARNISFSMKNDKIKAKKLEKGNKVGLICPATAVSDPNDLDRALEIINYYGLEAVIGKSVKSGTGYKSRTINERIEDLHKMFVDKSINAVFCIRGGYGSAQLLDSIDYDLIKNNPKIFCGYSDITALIIAIQKLSGLVTFHGPMLLSAFTPYTANYFEAIFFNNQAPIEMTNPVQSTGIRNPYPTRTIVQGKASGELVGGNLTTISTTLGTPYEIETKGKILFLEDVGEEPYRIDRMLTQLRLAGKFKDVKGIVFGDCVDCGFRQFESSRSWDFTLGEILNNFFANMKIPVFSGLLIGHSSDQITLPLGAEIELDATNCKLTLLENALI